MKNYNRIATGNYVREHRSILKDLCTWKKMTEEEYAALSAEDKAWMEERCDKLLEDMKRLYDIANNIC